MSLLVFLWRSFFFAAYKHWQVMVMAHRREVSTWLVRSTATSCAVKSNP